MDNDFVEKILNEVYEYYNYTKELLNEAKDGTAKGKNRHRDGYYDEYALRTGKKDRHSPGYYERYRAKRKTGNGSEGQEGIEKTNRNNRNAYYRKYNAQHPERLERGYTKGYVDGNVSQGRADGSTYTDSLGRPHNRDFYNPTMTDLIDSALSVWHDDDWCEDVD